MKVEIHQRGVKTIFRKRDRRLLAVGPLLVLSAGASTLMRTKLTQR